MMPDFENLSKAEEAALDALFEEARGDQPPVSSDLLARVMADAADVSLGTVPVLPSPRPSLWARFGDIFGQLGGVPGASVMTACALFGLSLGYAGPDELLGYAGLSQISETLEFDAQVDVFETADFTFDEGDLLQ